MEGFQKLIPKISKEIKNWSDTPILSGARGGGGGGGFSTTLSSTDQSHVLVNRPPPRYFLFSLLFVEMFFFICLCNLFFFYNYKIDFFFLKSVFAKLGPKLAINPNFQTI